MYRADICKVTYTGFAFTNVQLSLCVAEVPLLTVRSRSEVYVWWHHAAVIVKVVAASACVSAAFTVNASLIYTIELLSLITIALASDLSALAIVPSLTIVYIWHPTRLLLSRAWIGNAIVAVYLGWRNAVLGFIVVGITGWAGSLKWSRFGALIIIITGQNTANVDSSFHHGTHLGHIVGSLHYNLCADGMDQGQAQNTSQKVISWNLQQGSSLSANPPNYHLSLHLPDMVLNCPKNTEWLSLPALSFIVQFFPAIWDNIVFTIPNSMAS